MGEINRELRNYKEAKYFLEKSLSIFKAHYVDDHIRIALGLRELSKTFLLEGCLDMAEAFLDEAAEVFQKNTHPRVYVILEDRAELFFKKSQIAQCKGEPEQANNFKIKAVEYLKQALKIAKSHFPITSSHISRIQDRIKRLEQN